MNERRDDWAQDFGESGRARPRPEYDGLSVALRWGRFFEGRLSSPAAA
jgi:hypothetical protein